MRPRKLEEIWKRFYHISTDEVYGSLGAEGLFTETTAYDPIHHIQLLKVQIILFVYGETYGLPYVLTNCSNNYGPFHFPEKLIPLFINNIQNKPLPVYGDGKYTVIGCLWKIMQVIDLVFS
jgi:dTDP-glucose 4,6-dehydratase